MSAMTADHDHVAPLLLGQVVNFLAWLAVGQVAVFAWRAPVYFTINRSRRSFGLIELLLLQL
jgi:hypothetical protein